LQLIARTLGGNFNGIGIRNMRYISNAIGSLQSSGLQPVQYPREYLMAVEVALQGALPKQYSVLVEKFGPFLLPGEPSVELYDPAVICAYVGSIYNMDDQLPHTWPAVPIARYGDSGDDLGFLRSGRDFSPALVLLDHEGPWTTLDDYWHSEVAESLSAFVVSRLQGQ
jgi:hypothetical protein